MAGRLRPELAFATYSIDRSKYDCKFLFLSTVRLRSNPQRNGHLLAHVRRRRAEVGGALSRPRRTHLSGKRFECRGIAAGELRQRHASISFSRGTTRGGSSEIWEPPEGAKRIGKTVGASRKTPRKSTRESLLLVVVVVRATGQSTGCALGRRGLVASGYNSIKQNSARTEQWKKKKCGAPKRGVCRKTWVLTRKRRTDDTGKRRPPPQMPR